VGTLVGRGSVIGLVGCGVGEPMMVALGPPLVLFAADWQPLRRAAATNATAIEIVAAVDRDIGASPGPSEGGQRAIEIVRRVIVP
jgi:hypothetical protein